MFPYILICGRSHCGIYTAFHSSNKNDTKKVENLNRYSLFVFCNGSFGEYDRKQESRSISKFESPQNKSGRVVL